MSTTKMTTHPHLHVIERIDAQGVYCLVWTGGAAEGDETQYTNLEAAAWAIAGHAARTSETMAVTVYGDDTEFSRFQAARREAERHYQRQQRIAIAPRDKLTGRPLFVAL